MTYCLTPVDSNIIGINPAENPWEETEGNFFTTYPNAKLTMGYEER